MKDHPRVCGEKEFIGKITPVNEGSPPRVRGKGFSLSQSAALTGITPACAGKSGLCCKQPVYHEDHPRVCGEKFTSTAGNAFTLGSPPRVRGKELFFDNHYFIARITPACAGKSKMIKEIKAYDKDHPRVCGEKSPVDAVTKARAGSPPRVRGKGRAFTSAFIFRGITPACAGKRSLLFELPPFPEDHPRVCGEKFSNSVI